MIYHPQPVQPAMGVGGVVYGQQVPAIIQYPGIETVAIYQIKSFIITEWGRKTSLFLKPTCGNDAPINHIVRVNLRRD